MSAYTLASPLTQFRMCVGLSLFLYLCVWPNARSFIFFSLAIESEIRKRIGRVFFLVCCWNLFRFGHFRWHRNSVYDIYTGTDYMYAAAYATNYKYDQWQNQHTKCSLMSTYFGYFAVEIICLNYLLQENLKFLRQQHGSGGSLVHR